MGLAGQATAGRLPGRGGEVGGGRRGDAGTRRRGDGEDGGGRGDHLADELRPVFEDLEEPQVAGAGAARALFPALDEFRGCFRTYWPRDGPEMALVRGGGPKRLKSSESLRSDNEATGPFPAHPLGRTAFRLASASTRPQRLDKAESLRARSLMRGENRAVARPLGSETAS